MRSIWLADYGVQARSMEGIVVVDRNMTRLLERYSTGHCCYVRQSFF